MSEEIRYRCEVGPELASRAEAQLRELLLWWQDRWDERVRARRRVPLRVGRWVGLSLALLGMVLTGFLIVVAPDAPCRSGRAVLPAVARPPGGRGDAADGCRLWPCQPPSTTAI